MIGGAEAGGGTRIDVHEADSAALKIPTRKMENLIRRRTLILMSETVLNSTNVSESLTDVHRYKSVIVLSA